MESNISPLFLRLANWRPSWKVGPKQSYPVELVLGYKAASGKGDERLIMQVKQMVMHVLNSSITPAFAAEDIDRLFNANVLGEYGTGRYYAENGDPRTTMDKPGRWADLLNNKIASVIGNISFTETSFKEGNVSPHILEEVIADITGILAEIKIIEDWIHYHPAFLRQVFGKE
jgi:hypothetical protein